MQISGRGRRYADRHEAGRVLGKVLSGRLWADPIVLGLVRGGVPVAYELAGALPAELDVAVSLKIGAPGQPEFGIGAVTPEGEPVFDEATVAALGLAGQELRERAEQIRAEARRRVRLYRDERPEPRLHGRSVLLVDDGLATGVTARAALRSLRTDEPRELILAVPVGPTDSAEALQAEADEVVCVRQPMDFGAVGAWYRHFEQTSDDEVLALLRR